MIKKQVVIAACLLILLSVAASGCKFDISRILGEEDTGAAKAELIKVNIQFTDGEQLEAYIKDLGIEEGGKVYVGGSSLSYLYDVQGNIIGSYNYQRVLYIKIIPDKS